MLVLLHMEAFEGSCTEQGNIECWYCSGCGKYFADENCNEELPEKDVFTGEKHNWGDWQVMTDATCSTGGLQMRQCLDCKKTVLALIPMLSACDHTHCMGRLACRKTAHLQNGRAEDQAVPQMQCAGKRGYPRKRGISQI